MEYFIGIDISKQTLDVYDGEKSYEVPNEPGLKELKTRLRIDFLKSWKQVYCIYEPTGPYAKVLRNFCMKHSLRVYEVNPKQSANFARALGNRSKTDKIDAKMLREFNRVVDLDSFAIPIVDIVVEKLNSLLSSYEFALKSKTRIQNHLASQQLGGDLPVIIQTAMKKEINLLEQTEKTIIQEMVKIVTEDSPLLESYQNLISMPGVGTLTAIAFIHFFKKYPNANRSEIVALAGLDPKQKESGTSVKGKATISKAGNHLLRKILYFSCMSSSRYNDRIKKFYLRLIEENHKIPKVALVACMKKMLLIAHQLYVKNEKYHPLKIDKNSLC
jgi:transposase